MSSLIRAILALKLQVDMKLCISKRSLEDDVDGGGMSKCEWEWSHFLTKRGMMINKPRDRNHSDLRECCLFLI